ncbi:MAG TPA: type II CAAX endopeptidase family protein [Bacteroidales bacterium]|nr:type II CAAX endopeptidase family protein [Bacteroidales bacterium]HPR12217.1 type II CAAX endopeptidase family protein [Bacteroidales bacterium]HRW85849.1 type II CAAX endopeptidase family protein [Bacteroidales bacterium]
MSIRNLVFVRKYSTSIYFILVFVLSWGPIIFLAGPANLPIDPELSENILPILYTFMLIGPSVAGILLIGLVNGKEGFRNFKARLFRWRTGIRWYAVALLTAPALASIILFILACISPEFEIGLFNSEAKSGLILSGIITGLMVGIFEEVGWSGFLIPNLRLRHNIIITGIIVGLFWGAWHFILFWERDSFLGYMPLLILTGRLFTWLPPYRILMVWILDRTESLFLVILTHASLVFTTTVLVPMTLKGENLLIWLAVWSASLWIVVIAISTSIKRLNAR